MQLITLVFVAVAAAQSLGGIRVSAPGDPPPGAIPKDIDTAGFPTIQPSVGGSAGAPAPRNKHREYVPIFRKVKTKCECSSAFCPPERMANDKVVRSCPLTMS